MLRPVFCLSLSWCLFFVATVTLRSAEPTADFRDGVKAALQRGEKRIIIPPGTYRLGPKGGGELWLIQGARDVEIIADGVTLVGTKLMRAISLHRCSGVTLQGLTVDYDPLPFTQGEVVAAAADDGSIDVKLHAGYPRKPYSRIDVVDPKTRYRKKGMPFLWGTKAEMVGEDVVRVRLPGIAKTAVVGDLVSLSTGQEMGAPHAISVDGCERITFRNVTVHSAPGMGILEADGEGGSIFTQCKIVPGPKPADATEIRLLSSSWDAFQSKTIRKGPVVEECEISHAGDDSWSVQSSDYVVLNSEGGTVVLASRDEFTDGVQNGDRLRQNVEGKEYRITSRKVVSRAEAGLSEEVLEKLRESTTWSPWKVSPRCIVVTLDVPNALAPGDSVYSPDRMGNGFVFRNNHLHSPGRVLLKAGGLMEGNTLETPHALVVCPELPAGAAAGIDGLIIRNNIIRNGGWFCAAPWSSQAGIISITATNGSTELRTDTVFKDFIIEGNTIERGAGPHLVISSSKGLVLRNNRSLNPQQETPPDTGASYKIPKKAVMWLVHCEDAVKEGNIAEITGGTASSPGAGVTK
ncbi:right-handed parallel beta-helix repeat-containing protein [Verrucomicrobium sp. BvORR106]|uniref:right-handed parallel beta-helix repeat-containing protein n=1 Tax=Verrucomicrobium sp. BvORR106 TaxID=1403819 RepID=UPI000571E6F1|nr:right-handed parallel beta-helix repeat-containing protein [Verrucomicrobium sp. BvORR106]